MRLLILLCLCVAVCGQQVRFEKSPILFRNDAIATANWPDLMQQPGVSVNRLTYGAGGEAEYEREEEKEIRTRVPYMQQRPVQKQQWKAGISGVNAKETLIPTTRGIHGAGRVAFAGIPLKQQWTVEPLNLQQFQVEPKIASVGWAGQQKDLEQESLYPSEFQTYAVPPVGYSMNEQTRFGFEALRPKFQLVAAKKVEAKQEPEITLTERESESDLTLSGSRTSASKYGSTMTLDLSKTKASEHKEEGTGKAGVLFKLKQQLHDNHLEKMALRHEMKKESEPKSLKVLSGFTVERGMGERKERIKVKAEKPKLISPIVGITGITDHRLKFSLLPAEQQQLETEIPAPIQFQAPMQFQPPVTRFQQPYETIETAYSPLKLGYNRVTNHQLSFPAYQQQYSN